MWDIDMANDGGHNTVTYYSVATSHLSLCGKLAQ